MVVVDLVVSWKLRGSGERVRVRDLDVACDAVLVGTAGNAE